MELLDRCRELRGQIGRREALLQEASRAEKFNVRAQQMRDAVQELQAVMMRLEVLHRHRVSLGSIRSPTAAVQRLRSYGEKLQQAPDDSGNDHGHVKRAFDAINKALAAAADDAINNVLAQLPAIDETFLRQVEGNPVYAKKVDEIRLARKQLLVESKQLTADNLDAFLRRREELSRLADGLKPSEFPAEVLEFFKAARHGAPIEKFTDVVRQWLADRNQLTNIRIYLKGE